MGGISNPNTIVPLGNYARPGFGQSVTVPTFDTTLYRATNVSNSTYGTHIYSQLQAFSADQQHILLSEGGQFVIRRVSDYSQVTTVNGDWNVPRWHPTNPDLIIHFDSDADTTVRIQKTNVSNGVTQTTHTLPNRFDRVSNNQSFEELSRDGRWIGGMLESGNDRVLFTYDLVNNQLGAEISIDALFNGPCGGNQQDPDWVGVSPLGNYLVVQWVRDGTSRCSGLETFNISTGAFVGRVASNHQHGDLGVKHDGTTEIFMHFDIHGNGLGIIMRELPGTNSVSPPVVMQEIPWFASHISCQGPAGECLVTTYTDGNNSWEPFEAELFIQRTDGSVLRLAHARSTECGYWVQPRASISSNGRYVVFASDWQLGTGSNSCGGGNSLGRGEAYVIDLAGSGGPPPTCTSNAQCDDGIFCNGSEVCNNGSCNPGTPPSCSDNDPCTDDICQNDQCTNPPNNQCGGGSCAHDRCVEGVALTSGCDSCVTSICAADPYCCNNEWDDICVNQVDSVCNLSCNACTPTTCQAAGAQCGSIADGCGGTLNCGGCGQGQACNNSNQCEQVCTPTTCNAAGAQCGNIPDGCGGTLNCGGCAANEACNNNQCVCTPTTCNAAGAQCGTIDDGCGGTLNCGGCGQGQSCNGSNQCEQACTPTTCNAAGAQCGTIADGCGGTLNCGGCGSGQSCNNNNQCASTNTCSHDLCDEGRRLNRNCDSCVRDICRVDPYCCNNEWDDVCVEQVESVCNRTCGSQCVPTTCQAAGAQCGSIPDGCGGTLNCGGCAAGQSCNNSNQCVATSCAHDLCDEGSTLNRNCDSCVADICDADPYCCNTEWDDICVDQVASVCNRTCS